VVSGWRIRSETPNISVAKNCGSRKMTLSMAYKLMRSAEENWRRLRGFKLLADVIEKVRFIDGVKDNGTAQKDTTTNAIHQI